jgi:uncharacterized membrane protein YccC
MTLIDPWFLALKAALAASIAVLLTHLFAVEDPLSAGFVAVACVSPTAYAGLRRGGEQVAGSLLGGGISTLLRWLAPPSFGPAVVFGSVLVAVLACMRLGMRSAYAVAAFSAIYVVALPFASPTLAIETRLLALAIGIGVATIVNLVVSAAVGDRIVERRIRLARGKVADTLAEHPRADADDRFEQAFAVIAELQTDLEGARRELFGGRARKLAETHLAEAIRLRRLLHVAKTLVLLERADAATLAEAVSSLRAGPLDEPTVAALFARL